ncbi:hypothetical protein CB1_001460003 [Camelus ferus]|nr:hypothetical protein CB1_001460003 [Camelus ferus]
MGDKASLPLGTLLYLPQVLSFSAEDVTLAIHPAQRPVLLGKDAQPPGLRTAWGPWYPQWHAAKWLSGGIHQWPLAPTDGTPFCSVNGMILTPGKTDDFRLPKYLKKALQLCSAQSPSPGLDSWILM